MSKFLISAALVAVLAALGTNASAQKTTGTAAFCLQSEGSGDRDCSFASMEQCKKAMTGGGETCVPNPEAKAGGGGGKKKSADD